MGSKSKKQRARGRKGRAKKAPAPSPPTRTGFLSLPRELRDIIYDYALILNDNCDGVLIGPNPQTIYPLVEFMDWPLPKNELSLNIILCNKQVANEARATLYGRNKFSFWSTGCWWYFVRFLRDIGLHNVHYLRFVELRDINPEIVQQRKDGSRTMPSPMLPGQVIRYQPRLHSGPGRFEERQVLHIDPLIRECFLRLGLLGSCFRLELSFGEHLPNFPAALELNYDPADWWTNQLTRVFDNCLRDFNTDCRGNCRVHVYWRGQSVGFHSSEDALRIAEAGWCISWSRDIEGGMQYGFSLPGTHYLLKYIYKPEKLSVCPYYCA